MTDGFNFCERQSLHFFSFDYFSCIKFLIDKQEDVTSDEDLIVKTIPEIIVAYNHGSSKKDNTALNLIVRIGEIYQVR